MNLKALLLRFSSVMIVLFVFSSCAKEKTGTIDDQEQIAIDFFDEIVMTDIVEEAKEKRLLRRWQEDVKIYIHYPLPDFLDSTLVHVIDSLNSYMTTSSIEIVDDVELSNCQLYYTTTTDLNSLFTPKDHVSENIGGNAKIWFRNSVIYRARVFVSSDRSELYSMGVLYEEVAQVLGPISDTENYNESIFSQAGLPPFPDNVAGFFPMDKELLRLHYSDVVSPGMDHEEVREALEEHYMCD